MRYAIFSDVHANDCALNAVLAHAKTKQIDQFIFLGDVFGYGPSPVECLRRLRSEIPLRNWVLGNHDAHLVRLPEVDSFSRIAAYTQNHHRGMIQQEKQFGWCKKVFVISRAGPKRVKSHRGEVIFAHARLEIDDRLWHDRISTYVFPWPKIDGLDQRKVTVEAIEKKRLHNKPIVLIHGHIHLPYMMTARKSPEIKLTRHSFSYQEGQKYSLEPYETVLISPGSVGLPREPDPEPHANYGILEISKNSFHFEFQRVLYNPKKVQDAMARYNYDPDLIELLNGYCAENRVWQDNEQVLEWNRAYDWTGNGWSVVENDYDL